MRRGRCIASSAEPAAGDARAPAVVVDLDSLPGLQCARILAARGVPVIAIARNPRHPNCRTRVCRDIRIAPDGDVRAALMELGPELDERAVLFLNRDADVVMVARHREELEQWYHVMVPSLELVETLMMKDLLAGHAAERDLPIPTTVLIHDDADAERAATVLGFPCVLKPAFRSGEWIDHTRTKAFTPTSGEELLELFRDHRHLADTFVAQDWIPGGDDRLCSFFGYFDRESKPLVTFVAKKVRQWPPHTGITSLGIECRDDEVLTEGLRLFSGIGYTGLAYVEFKRHETTGRLVIIEPNVGRVTGRSGIVEAGGVELLYTMYCDALGLPLPTARTQTYGSVKWLHVRGDLQSAWHYWRAGELTPGQWVRSLRGAKTYPIASWHDPLPFVADTARVVRIAVSSRVPRRRREAA